MAQTNTALRLYQWGREATKGTAVAATSQIACLAIDFEDDDELARPAFARGYACMNPGTETPVKRGTNWTIRQTPLVFDQFHHILAMSVAGNVTPTGPVDSAYTWVCTRPLASLPSVDSYTLERRLTSGSGPKDIEVAYAMLSQVTIAGAANGAITMAGSGFARRRKDSTLTAALNPNQAVHPVFAQSQVYVDDTYAGIGGTDFVPQILDWSLSIDTGLKPLFAADARSDLDFNTHVLDATAFGFTFEVTALVDTLFTAEQTFAEAINGGGVNGLRAIRLKLTNGVLIGASATRSLVIDMLARLEKASVIAVDARDGQDIVTLRWVQTVDGVNPPLKATLVNAASAYT